MSAAVLKFVKEIYPEYGLTGNATHARGVPFNQLYQAYPALEPFYSDFEKNFDPMPILTAMRDNDYIIPVTCVVVYMLFCFFGQKIMANYKPFGLVNTLAAWNLFLSLFS